ncbi:MAG: TolC family protein [Candidatus Margulisiibacteriota bacterium]
MAILIIFLSSQANSLTWPQVLNEAARSGREIKSAQKQLEVARWTYYKSYSGFLPQISANMSAGQSDNSTGQSNSYSYGLSFSQSLFKGFSNYNNLSAAGASLAYYQASLQYNEADYYYQLRQAFVNLYLGQRNIDVLKAIRQSRDENARMIKLLYDSGREDKGNYLRTDAQRQEADYRYLSAGRQLELAKLKLSQLIETQVSSVEGEFVPAPIGEPDFDSLLKEAPAYKMSRSQLTLAEIDQRATISEFLPTVSLQGSYSKSGSNWPPDSSSKSLSLNLSYPLFPGGSNIAERVISDAQYDKAKEDFSITKKEQYFAIRQAYETFRDALEEYKLAGIYLDASTQRAQIAQVKYLNGLVSYNEWDQVQNEYFSSQNSLINSLKSALLAEAAWHKSYGGHVK